MRETKTIESSEKDETSRYLIEIKENHIGEQRAFFIGENRRTIFHCSRFFLRLWHTRTHSHIHAHTCIHRYTGTNMRAARINTTHLIYIQGQQIYQRINTRTYTFIQMYTGDVLSVVAIINRRAAWIVIRNAFELFLQRLLVNVSSSTHRLAR